MHEARLHVPSPVPRLDPASIRGTASPDGANRRPEPTTEILFERVRPGSRQTLSCELRCCRESGWELRFLAGSCLLCSYGGFGTRKSAVRFAEGVRSDLG